MRRVITNEGIADRIFIIRGQRVMVDRDLAALYGVSTKRLNEQVKRNPKRFPEDFMFQLGKSEASELVANCDRFTSLKHSSVAPYVFSEQGVAMLSSVLNSERAVVVNVQIMRAFVKLRECMVSHKDLQYKIETLERKFKDHDNNFKVVFEAIRQLMAPPPEKPKTPIGFHVK